MEGSQKSASSLGASPLSETGTPLTAGGQSARVNVGPFPTPAGSSVGASPLTASPEVPAIVPRAPSTATPSPAPAPAPAPAELTTAAKKAADKRKNLMANIEERASKEGYVPTAKNLKDLRDKVEFFNKKDAAGLLKAGSELAKKHERAKQLLARIERVEGAPALTTRRRTAKAETSRLNLAAGGTTAAPAGGTTAAAALASGLRLQNAPLTLKRMTAKRRAALEALRARVPTPWPSPRYGQTPLTPSPLNLGPAVPLSARYASSPINTNAIRRLVAAPLESERKENRTRRSKYSLTFNSPTFVKYLEMVVPEFLPLPELYNPYTGVKYAPEESPLEDIERAFLELKDIRNQARRKALKLQKASEKRAETRRNRR